jgi:TatA/E family protein of Tat protein translocase
MEVMVILIVALIIFGPGKLPEVAGQAGKMVRDFRRATRELTSEFQESIDDVQATMGEMKATVTDLQRETEAIAQSIPESLDVSEKPKAKVGAASTRTSPAAATNTAPAEASQAVALTEAVATKDDPLADIVGIDEDESSARAPGAAA